MPGKNGARPSLLDGSPIANEYGTLSIGPEGDKTVYLTFDAGYGSENVAHILDVLKENGVRAAFFILPGIINNDLALVKRMADEGHTVCNHSWSHGDMSGIADINAFSDELTKLEALYREKTGYEMSRYFRPPEGAFSVKMLGYCKSLGYVPVFWSFAYRDWDNSAQPSAEKSQEKIISSLHDGMVLLLHPNSATNASILDGVIKAIAAKGYSFGTLDELSQKLAAQ